jgi:hypothetical protein
VDTKLIFKLILEYTMIAECVMSIACLAIMWRKRLLRDMWGLAAFLAVYAVEIFLSIGIMYFRRDIGIEPHHAWMALYFTKWIGALVEYALLLIVIYGAFRLAMKPLRGLHRAGKMIFRWIAVVSLLLSLGMAFGPRITDPAAYLVGVVAERLQQGTSVLLLCMLVFVCFATRYLGLTFRSRIFGILLGLGIFSACTLVESAWLATQGAQTVYAPVLLVSAFGFLACIFVWSGYFLAPEPERKLVLLPTTSPYFFWNQVSEALGDDPGHVVVSGFTPDMLSPGEIQMLKKAPAPSQPSMKQEQIPVKVASGI